MVASPLRFFFHSFVFRGLGSKPFSEGLFDVDGGGSDAVSRDASGGKGPIVIVGAPCLDALNSLICSTFPRVRLEGV